MLIGRQVLRCRVMADVGGNDWSFTTLKMTFRLTKNNYEVQRTNLLTIKLLQNVERLIKGHDNYSSRAVIQSFHQKLDDSNTTLLTQEGFTAGEKQ